MHYQGVLTLVAGGVLLAQTPAPQPASAFESKSSRVGELERLGENGRDYMVLGLDAPGFDKLKISQKKFAYYLYRAAIAGNDICYLQNHRFALDIKELLETIYENRVGKAKLNPAILEGLEEYLKAIWINHGQYSHWNHTKFVPRKLTFVQLQKAVQVATKNGAKFTFRKGVNLNVLKPHIFDPKVEPLQVAQGAPDVIKASASGLYDPGLTMKEIQALPKEMQTKLNVRFALKKGKKGKVAEPEVFMTQGAYGEQLKMVNYWLKKSLNYVDNERVMAEKDGVKKTRFESKGIQKMALEDLIAYFETGNEQKFKDHCIAWLKTRGAINYLNGFHEVYKDPRAVIGAYTAEVSFCVDAEKLDKLSQNAMYFESKMPWKDAWKRSIVDPPIAIAVNTILQTGDNGPLSPAAYNLPNYDEIRRNFGSKNVMLQNVMLASSPEIKRKTIQSFYLPEDQELMTRFGDSGRQWWVYLHEVIGHGSGQVDESLKGTEPSERIGDTYNALEECRAESVALYHCVDPKLVEIGAVNAEDHLSTAKALFLSMLGGQIMANGNLDGDVFRQSHLRGRQLILNYLTQPGQDFGVAIVQKDNHYFVQVNDLQKAKFGVGELLDKLQTLKAMGDKAGADALFEKLGNNINKNWQMDAKARIEAINRPRQVAFVFPQLVPVLGPAKFAKPKEGEEIRQDLKDVVIKTEETLAEQMIRFRHWSKSREIFPK